MIENLDCFSLLPGTTIKSPHIALLLLLLFAKIQEGPDTLVPLESDEQALRNLVLSGGEASHAQFYNTAIAGGGRGAIRSHALRLCICI